MVQHGQTPHVAEPEEIETPRQAFARRMPEGGTVVDEEAGEAYHAKK